MRIKHCFENNPSFPNWEYWLTQVDLYNSRKTVADVVVGKLFTLTLGTVSKIFRLIPKLGGLHLVQFLLPDRADII